MARKKPAKSSSKMVAKRRSPSASKNRDAWIGMLRETLNAANEMPPGSTTAVVYDEIAALAKQMGGETAGFGTPVGRAFWEAQLGLATTAWALQGPAAAVEMLKYVLEADPADDLLARNWLVAALLDLGRDVEAAALWRRFQDASPLWQFAGALLAFRQQGDRETSVECLLRAQSCDPGFANFLLGDAVARADEPVRFHGSPAQVAHSIARLLLPAWRNTPGATAWARRVLNTPSMQAKPGPELPALPPKLCRLPQKKTTWQLGLRRKEPNEQGESGGEALWLLFIADVGERQARIVTIVEGEPTPAVVWQHFLTALEHPLEGKPSRPSQLVVCAEAFAEAWQPLLRELNIACAVDPQPQPVTTLMEGLAQLAAQQALPQGPLTIDVGTLPQTDEIWQVGFFHSTEWVSNAQGGAYRPWITLILNAHNHQALASASIQGEPAPAVMLDHVVRAMAREQGGYRPQLIEVADSDCFDLLQPQLAKFGVTCRLRDELPELDELCRKMARQSDARDKCALADGKRVTKDHMAAFYHAAAEYFREQPWRRVAGEIPLRVHCPEAKMTRYAVVLGRTGVQLGCAFYDTLQDYSQTMYGGGIEGLRLLAVCYDEAMVMAGVDLWHIERNGWPIASPEAYPAVWRTEPRCSGRPPNAGELTYLTAALEVIPHFLKTNGAPRNYACEVNGHSLNLMLSW